MVYVPIARRVSSIWARISVISALALIPLFAWESFRGGIDVAGRVLRPRLDLAPGLVDYRLGLTSNAARVFFINLVSLLPGTLTADLDGDRMRVHALNLGADPLPGVRRLEQRVAALFREALPAGAGTPL
jgi:multicomponent Na+:H+ antiporter subunit E